MSFDVDEIKNIKKCRKRHWLSTFCRTFFGCATKNEPSTEQCGKSYTSIAIQCQVERDLEKTDFPGEDTILFGSNTKFITIVENDIYSQRDDFKRSLKKLDNLINTLSEIQGLYKKKSLKCCQSVNEALNSKDENLNAENKENISQFEPVEKYQNWYPQDNEIFSQSQEEVLKFNINLDKNRYIQCHTNKGKVIENSTQRNFNPLILHRCESEFLLTKHSEDSTHNVKIKHLKSSIEITNKEVSQLQRSFHTLPGHFGKSIINLTSFRSNLIDHMRNIKDDVTTLRSILCSIEYLFLKNEKPMVVPICFEEIRKWFVERDPDTSYNMYDKSLNKEVLKLEERRYVEARIRATNFCKFYTLAKFIRPKPKAKKYKRLKI